MNEIVNNLGIANWWMPDFALVITFVTLLAAGFVVMLVCRLLLKLLGFVLFACGLACVVWFGYAYVAPTQFLEPPTTLPMFEQMGQQMLLVPHTPGSGDIDLVNLNRVYGRTFPQKSMFTVRYYDFNAVVRGVRFMTHAQTPTSLYVIEPPPPQPELKP